MNMMGISREDAGKIASKYIKQSFKDPKIRFFERMSNGDRRMTTTGLYQYIKANVQAENIIAPSFTTYVNSTKKPSLQSEYIFENVAQRSVSKKEAHSAKSSGDMSLYRFKNTEQNNKKIQNNEVSGLYATKSSVIHNPTAHSALTSATRTITSMTNASNERLVGGNRALLTTSDVLRSIVNESTYSNQAEVDKAVKEFNIHLPTVDEVVKILQYSSDLYFKDKGYYQRYIIPYLEKITPEQRATIAYTTDLHHLKELNPDFTRTLLLRMSEKLTGFDTPLEDPSIIKKVPEAIRFFVHNIFVDEVRGFGHDYDEMNKAGHAHNIYMTCRNVWKVLQQYESFFHAFFRTEIAPINSHKMRNVRRRSVVLSDTDSSAFATDNFVEWIFGKFVINQESIGLTGAITYLSSENIVHQLAKISSYMNVEKDKLHQLAMKNEWLWYVHIPTTLSKHYMADAAIQEGNVYKETSLESKGVHLKSSNVPTEIIARGEFLITEVFRKLRENEEIELDPILREAIQIEKDVIESITKHEIRYLRTQSINDPDSYTKGETDSPFRNHTFYVDCFQDAYGRIPDPPYVVVKLPTTLGTKAKIKKWIDGIDNRDIRDKLRDWNKANDRNSLNNIFLNHTLVLSGGIPKEILPIIDINAVIKDMTTQIRMILETLGITLVPDVPIHEQIILPEIEH